MARSGGWRLFAIGGLVGAVVLIAACTGARESTPPTPSASAPAADAAAGWTQLAIGEPLYGGAFEGPFDEVTAGVAYGEGFVLVGRSIDADDVWRGVVWTSPDGASWTRVVDGGAGFDGMYIPKVATDGQRLVALGWAVPWGNSTHGPYVAWVSDDGVTWQRHDEVDSTDLGRIDADGTIVGSASGFLAWGSQPDGHTALMRSMDGLAWQEVTFPDARKADIRSVAPYGTGFLAVGAEQTAQLVVGGSSPAARAWWSADGQQWMSARVDGGWSLQGVYPAVAGVYAVGAQECSRCVGPRLAWRSVDGRGWSSTGVESGLYPFVASNGSQIAVFDWQGDRSIALSDDGLNWHKAVTEVPAAEYDAGMIVGRNGVLLLVARTPVVGGIQVVHAGVLFLRGS